MRVLDNEFAGTFVIGLDVMTKHFIVFWFIINSFCYGQEGFHKIYLFEDTFAIVHDVYPTDTGYYFAATAGYPFFRSDVVFGRLDSMGNIDFNLNYVEPSQWNNSFRGRSQLDTNFRGNLILGYPNQLFGFSEGNGVYPRLTEIDFNGNIIFDKTFIEFYNDSLFFRSLGEIIPYNSDSTYYGAFGYYDWSTDSNTGEDGENGVLLFKVNYLGDTLWTKRFRYSPTGLNRPIYAIKDLHALSSDELILIVEERKYFPPNNAEQDWSKMHFYTLSTNGDVISSFIFQDSQDCHGGWNVLPLADGTYIYPYFESELNTENAPINDNFDYWTKICRTDGSGSIIWKDTLNGILSYQYNGDNTPFHLVSVNDSLFSGSYNWVGALMYDSSDWTTLRTFNATRVFQRRIDTGEEIWGRNYYYFPLADSINPPYYRLHDFEKTADGGFITCGQVISNDSISANVPGQYGYVLKVNCLGFLSTPQTAASYTINGDSVIFTNESVMAGSYQWIFGDGDTLDTGEVPRIIHHQYADTSTYSVQLIGYGCNGVSDTLFFDVQIDPEPSDTTIYEGDGTLLTLFPNPVNSGESLAFYIGNIDSSVVHRVVIYDLNGRLIDEFSIAKGNSTYFSIVDYSAGMYQFVLVEDDKVLEVERLVIN